MGKKILALVLLVTVAILGGCSRGTDVTTELQIYTYPNVLFPVPQRVLLTRQDKGTPVEIELNKADLSSLMRIVRTAVDTPLDYEEKVPDWEKSKAFSLEFTYEKNAQIDLMVGNDLITFETNKLLIDLEQKTMLIKLNEETKILSGMALNDSFIGFLKEYSRDLGFPLPPAVKDSLYIEKLPLAKPGGSKIEFLPPAVPRKKTSLH